MAHPARDAGYTLIEVMVTIGLMCALMAIAVIGFDHWSAASNQSGTAREIQSLLRSTQERAVTEGNAMCVDFETMGGHYTVYRGTCEDAGKVEVDGPRDTDGRDIHLANPAFTGTDHPTGVTFYARGSATPGTVTVTRTGSTKVYTLTVEGLTGRVSLA